MTRFSVSKAGLDLVHCSDSVKLCVWLCRLPSEPPTNDLLELFHKLQQNVVCLLEVCACRAKLTGDMQLAQAQLVAQRVSGVTSKGMMTGQVELVSCSFWSVCADVTRHKKPDVWSCWSAVALFHIPTTVE